MWPKYVVISGGIGARILLALLIAGFGVMTVVPQPSRVIEAQSLPYPPSDVMTGIDWDFTSIVELAPGSDNWPITWSDDDHQYTSWGDGGGFNGDNINGRVSLGFARIEGDHNSYSSFNVWGGVNTENSAQFQGKSYGIISVGGVLYAWLGSGGDNSQGSVSETRVIKSTDKGATWFKPSSPMWTKNDNLYLPTFLNFGKDNAGSRDDFVYSYFPRGSSWALHKPGKADLARVPQGSIMDKASYEWFAGLDSNGDPVWTADLTQRQPVFEDPNGLRTVSVGFDSGLGRYLLTSQHSDAGTNVGTNKFGVFEAPEPWGPWRTVVYENDWAGGTGNISFYFAPKWFSQDGLDFTMVYTKDDSWGTIRGRFVLAGSSVEDVTPPSAPGGLTATANGSSQTDLSWNAATDDESGIASYKVYRDGAKIATVTDIAFNDAGLSEATTFGYEVSAVNGAGIEGPRTSQVFATTSQDTLAPSIDQVFATGNPNAVVVVFSEAVEQASAETAGNYSIDNGIEVLAASLGADLQKVTLTTSQLSEGIQYLLTVNNIKDRASSQNVIATNSEAAFSFINSLEVTNLSVASGKNYLWQENLDLGQPVYIDRTYTFTALPSGFVGSGYFMAANDDKNLTDNPFLSFDVNQEVQVYVARDDRLGPATWMGGFTDTGQDLAFSPDLHSIWSRLYSAGTVSLGGNEGNGGPSMYIVIVRPSSGQVGNSPPIASDDVIIVATNTVAVINVLTNDSDIDGDSLSIVGSTQASHGVTEASIDGTMNYLSNADYTGPDSFTYTVGDGNGGTSTATVWVEVLSFLPTFPGFSQPVADTDGDGLFEDINANGRLDFADLVALFENFSETIVTNNWQLFDFNGNGESDMGDVLAMFQLLTS